MSADLKQPGRSERIDADDNAYEIMSRARMMEIARARIAAARQCGEDDTTLRELLRALEEIGEERGERPAGTTLH